MKKSIYLLRKLLTAVFLCAGFSAIAQDSTMQFFRPDNQYGINVFETSKEDNVPFTATKVKVGGNFEQSFQTLRDQNTAVPTLQAPYVGSVTSLIPLTNGF